jgi:hypothetical protein
VAVCETCGNDYDKPLLIRSEAGDEHVVAGLSDRADGA